MINLADDAMTIKLDYELPEYPKFEEGYRRAPRRESHLTEADKALAIKNALRYIHPDHHEQMAKEFAAELEEQGIHPNTIELSIGTEHIDDIIADLERGFAAV